MAGFEVIVRPVVMPNIRPQPAQTLPPANDPEKGFCVIRGNPAKSMDLTTSWSRSTSKSHQVETQRRVDTARVYQQDDDGTVNRDNFVDVEVPNKIWTRGGKQPAIDGRNDAADVQPGEIFVPGGKTKGNSMEIAIYYAKQIEARNIEIKKRNEIRKKEEEEANK